MQQPLEGMPVRRVLVDPSLIIKLVKQVAQHNYDLGRQAGYRHGRRDQAEGRPWDPGIPVLPHHPHREPGA